MKTFFPLKSRDKKKTCRGTTTTTTTPTTMEFSKQKKKFLDAN
jgi:hypothetical protein